MNVSKSSSIPLNGPTDGYVLMNDWRWNHDREPSRGGRNVNQKAKKRFSYGQRTKERQRGKNWWSKNVVLLNGCRRWGLRFTVRKRERLLKEGGARRRQLSRVPSVVQGSHAVPPVRFFFKFFSSSPSFGGCCFRVLGRLVLFLYVNIIAIPVSRSRSAYRVRLLHLLLLLLSSYNFFLVGAQHLTATTATL